MPDHDPGPSASVVTVLAAAPSYAALKANFWFDWGRSSTGAG
jgi:hypothetical protein